MKKIAADIKLKLRGHSTPVISTRLLRAKGFNKLQIKDFYRKQLQGLSWRNKHLYNPNSVVGTLNGFKEALSDQSLLVGTKFLGDVTGVVNGLTGGYITPLDQLNKRLSLHLQTIIDRQGGRQGSFLSGDNGAKLSDWGARLALLGAYTLAGLGAAKGTSAARNINRLYAKTGLSGVTRHYAPKALKILPRLMLLGGAVMGALKLADVASNLILLHYIDQYGLNKDYRAAALFLNSLLARRFKGAANVAGLAIGGFSPISLLSRLGLVPTQYRQGKDALHIPRMRLLWVVKDSLDAYRNADKPILPTNPNATTGREKYKGALVSPVQQARDFYSLFSGIPFDPNDPYSKFSLQQKQDMFLAKIKDPYKRALYSLIPDKFRGDFKTYADLDNVVKRQLMLSAILNPQRVMQLLSKPALQLTPQLFKLIARYRLTITRLQNASQNKANPEEALQSILPKLDSKHGVRPEELPYIQELVNKLKLRGLNPVTQRARLQSSKMLELFRRAGLASRNKDVKALQQIKAEIQLLRRPSQMTHELRAAADLLYDLKLLKGIANQIVPNKMELQTALDIQQGQKLLRDILTDPFTAKISAAVKTGMQPAIINSLNSQAKEDIKNGNILKVFSTAHRLVTMNLMGLGGSKLVAAYKKTLQGGLSSLMWKNPSYIPKVIGLWFRSKKMPGIGSLMLNDAFFWAGIPAILLGGGLLLGGLFSRNNLPPQEYAQRPVMPKYRPLDFGGQGRAVGGAV